MFLIEIWPGHCCVECSCREIWDNKILLKIVTAQSCCLACAGARIRGNTTGWHLGIHPSTHYTIHTLVTGYISSKLNQFLIIPKKISCINLHHQEILTLWCSTNDSRVSRQSDSHTWSLITPILSVRLALGIGQLTTTTKTPPSLVLSLFVVPSDGSRQEYTL